MCPNPVPNAHSAIQTGLKPRFAQPIKGANMTTSTIVLIVAVAIAAIVLIAAIAWVARNKRTQHRRVEAGEIRDKAAEQSHKVGQREALADDARRWT
jgi:hypothetical protein